MGRSILLWLLGVPIPIIILLAEAAMQATSATAGAMPEEVSIENSARPVESRADQIWKGSHYVINR